MTGKSQTTIGAQRWTWSVALRWVLVVGVSGALWSALACSSPRVTTCTTTDDCAEGWRCVRNVCLNCAIHSCDGTTSDGSSQEGAPPEEPSSSQEPGSESGREARIEPGVERASEWVSEPSVSETLPDEGKGADEPARDTADAAVLPEPVPETPQPPAPLCMNPPPLPEGPRLSHVMLQFHTQPYEYVSGNAVSIMDMTRDGAWVAVGQYSSALVKLYRWDKGAYRLARTLWTGHARGLRSLRFSRNGQMLATGSVDASVRVWRVSSGALVHRLERHTSSVYDLDFSPDGKMLVSAGYYDYRIRLWDLSTGLMTKALYNRQRNTNSGSSAVYAVAFSPDGKTFATGSNDRYVKLWSVASGKVVRSFVGHGSVVWSVDFSPNGKLLVSAGNDRTARVWEVASGKQIAVLRNPNTTSDGYVYSAHFSKDGAQIVVSGGSDRRVFFWDVAKKAYVYKSNVFQHGSTVRTVRFHPSGDKALSVGQDQLLRVWKLGTKPALQQAVDVTSDLVYRWLPLPNGKDALVSWSNASAIEVWNIQQGRRVAQWTGHTEGVRALALAPNGQWAASASSDRSIRLWDVTTGRAIRTIANAHELSVNEIAFRPTGGWLASVGDDGLVKLWNVSTGKPVATLRGHSGRVSGVAFGPNGDTLVTVGEDKTPRVWDMTNLKKASKTLMGHTDRLLTVAYDPKGRFVATSGWDRRVRVWKTSDWSLAWEARDALSVVRRLAFSADGSQLVGGAYDRKVKVWEVSSGRLWQTFSGHLGPVTDVRFVSPSQIRSVGMDRTVRTWKLTTTSPPFALQGHTDEVTAVAYSPGGAWLASGSRDKAVRLWSATTRKSAKVLAGHKGAITCLAWHPKATVLASGDAASEIALWTVASGKRAVLPPGHKAAIVGVAFAPDGSWLASASTDGHVRLWSLAQNKLLREWKTPTGGDLLSMALTRDGAVLVTTHSDRTVRSWTTADGKLKRTERRHGSGKINAVAMDTQRVVFATGGDDNSVRLWNASSQAYSRGLYGHPGDVTAVAFGPDGDTVAAGATNASITLWLWRESHPVRVLTGHTGRIHSLSFHPGGQWLASAAGDKKIRVWPLRTKALVRTLFLQPYGGTRDVAFDATKNLLAVAGDNTYIRSYEATNRRFLRNLYGHSGAVQALAYHPGKNWLCSGSADRTIRLSSITASGYSRLRSFSAHRLAVTDLALTDKGNTLVSGSDDQTVKIWQLDPVNKQPPVLLDILSHGGAIRQLRVSADGRRLLTWASDRTVRLWDLKTGRLQRTYRTTTPLAGIALRPDGARVVVATQDGTLRIWKADEDAEAPNLVRKLKGTPVALRFAPKGRWLAVGLAQQEVALLEGACFRELQRYPVTFGPIQVLHWSPAGDKLFVGDANGGLTLWTCPLCSP